MINSLIEWSKNLTYDLWPILHGKKNKEHYENKQDVTTFDLI